LFVFNKPIVQLSEKNDDWLGLDVDNTINI